jgi:hypothetical protein
MGPFSGCSNLLELIVFILLEYENICQGLEKGKMLDGNQTSTMQHSHDSRVDRRTARQTNHRLP